MLTAHPDVSGHLRRLRPADHRRPPGHQGRRQEAGRPDRRRLRRLPRTRSTAIKAGDEAASVAQFPAKMGSLGIETAVAAARGETVEPNVDTGTEMVTKDNAAQFGA